MKDWIVKLVRLSEREIDEMTSDSKMSLQIITDTVRIKIKEKHIQAWMVFVLEITEPFK